MRVECNDMVTKEPTFEVGGHTNSTGWYRIAVEGHHEEDICEVKLFESPRKDCDSSNEKLDSLRILVSKNPKIPPTRLVNPLGFAIKEPLPICAEVFKKLNMT